MEDPENIHEIAIAKLYLEDLACTAALHLEDKCTKNPYGDFESYEDCRSFFENVLKDLDEEPWKDGGHCGDCTSMACTCSRCAYESYLEDARKEIKKYMTDRTKWFKIRRRVWHFIGRTLGVDKE